MQRRDLRFSSAIRQLGLRLVSTKGPVEHELNGANPFDYLTELLRHAEELKQSPSEWMPWNYPDTLARLATPAAAKYDKSYLAEKDHLWPGWADLTECRKTGPFRKQSLTTFSASDINTPRCFSRMQRFYS